MDWDAWVCGELSFRSNGVERWKKARVRTDAWPKLPAWIRPTVAADARVSAVLANIKGWADPLWRYVHAPDCVSVVATSSSVSLRAYLTGAWFAHFAGQLAALVVTAADVGAEGELVAMDMRTGKGLLFQLDGAHLAISTIDVTDPAARRLAEDARGWIEGKAQVELPDMLTPHPERRWREIAGSVGGRQVEPQTAPHPFRATMLEAGAVFESEHDLVARHFGAADREVARAKTSCAVFDASHGTQIRVSHADPDRFLASLCEGESSDAPIEVELADPESRTFADRALLMPFMNQGRLVEASAVDRGRLYDWLRARASECVGKAPTIEMPSLWSEPYLCFVGPDARKVAADVLGIPAVATMMPGTLNEVVCAERLGLPAIWAHIARTHVAEIGARCRALFAGSEAEDTLDQQAGQLPRARWSGAHQVPWTTRTMLRVPVLAEAETKSVRRDRKSIT